MLKKTLLIHLLLISPLCFYNLVKWVALKESHQLHTSLFKLHLSAESFSEISSLNKEVINKYHLSDPNYLYHEVELYPLNCKSEKIQLVESPLFENSFYKEKLETLARPVKVDLNDLRVLLEKIEAPISPNEKRPHLTISHLSLKKNQKNESLLYDLNFKLIKREYL